MGIRRLRPPFLDSLSWIFMIHLSLLHIPLPPNCETLHDGGTRLEQGQILLST